MRKAPLQQPFRARGVALWIFATHVAAFASVAALPQARSDAALAQVPSAATACSSPKLPPAILGGAAPRQSGKSLALIAAQAPAHALSLAVAATEADRELGLMCVTALAPHHGMIFVFASAGVEGFWMKRTLIPLDMVWVASNGRVTAVASNVPASTLDTPDDAVARRSGEGLYVIELPAGEAASDGLRAGERIALPALHAID
jgi:uncharacterized membrane protein (UPF0127 family)